MKRHVAAAFVAALAGCAVAPVRHAPVGGEDAASHFSSARPSAALPDGWSPWKVRRDKRETRYTLVVDDVPQDDGSVQPQVVLKAEAQASASGLKHPLGVDLQRYPRLRWAWKVQSLIERADNTRREAEDSPVRVILAFDGDPARLSLRDRLAAEQARLLTGNELPYATLIYIWENRLPVGTVIPNAHSARVQMVVAESGAAGVGQWRLIEREVAADFRRAFGEAPGRLLGISVLTDTDNTGTGVTAYYGDLEFVGAAETAGR